MTKKTLMYLLVLCLTVAMQAAAACANESADGPATTPTAAFTDHGDGTVTHVSTGLTWMRCSLGQTWDGRGCAGTAKRYTWQQALQAAADANSGVSNDDGDGQPGFAGHADWRLPGKIQLESVIEESCLSPSINVTVFPDTPSTWFWTATPSTSNPDIAWLISFHNGYDGADDKTYAARVRLVRGR